MFFDEKLAIRMKNLLLSELSTELCELLNEQRRQTALLELILKEQQKTNDWKKGD